MRIGFLGLGNMGAAIARNFINAGHAVTVWNRSPGAAASFADVAATPADAARGAELVFTILADDESVASVVLGPDGVVEGLSEDAIHLSCTTISVAMCDRLEAEHGARGQQFLAAPVFGRPPAAAAGQLVVTLGGPAALRERVTPVLGAISRAVLSVGDRPSQASLLKLTGNFLITCLIETLGETFALVEKGGVDRAVLHQLVTQFMLPGPMVQGYATMIRDHAYSPAGFKMALGQKDVRLALAAAEALQVPLPFASVVRDRFLAARANGDEALDWSGIARRAAADAGLG